jgi:hypothetical protein
MNGQMKKRDFRVGELSRYIPILWEKNSDVDVLVTDKKLDPAETMPTIPA